jgi:hypothetical protein
MADSAKKKSGEKSKEEKKRPESKTDRKRLAYLKSRSKELKAEMQAVKKEAIALRVKLGMDKKAKAQAKKADASKA